MQFRIANQIFLQYASRAPRPLGKHQQVVLEFVVVASEPHGPPREDLRATIPVPIEDAQQSAPLGQTQGPGAVSNSGAPGHARQFPLI